LSAELLFFSTLSRSVRNICAQRDRLALCLFGDPGEHPRAQPNCANWPAGSRKVGKNMWRINCPVCDKEMEKKLPTETVACSCVSISGRANQALPNCRHRFASHGAGAAA